MIGSGKGNWSEVSSCSSWLYCSDRASGCIRIHILQPILTYINIVEQQHFYLDFGYFTAGEAVGN